MTIKNNCYISNIPLKLTVVGLMTLCCFNTVSALVCKSLIASDDTQFILSHPQYGQRNYSNKYKSCWILTAETGTKVVGITRHDFVLENSTSACSKDVLQIFDSNTDSGKSIKFCGVNIFKNLYSSQEFMYLKFSTNKKNQFEGFNISFKQYSYSVYKSDLWSSKYYKYPEENQKNGGFNTGGIVGIVIGVGISSYIVCLAMNKRKQRKQQQVQAANQARTAQPAASSASNSASNQSACTQGQTSSTQGQATTTSTTTPTVSVVGTNDVKSTVLPPDAAPPSYIDLFGALPLPPAYGNPPQTSGTTQPLASAAYLAPTSVEEPS